MNLRPLKRFGQNFLVDKNIVRKIVNLIDPQPSEIILEIGPGRGALTEELLKTESRLTAIEIDRALCAQLREKYAAAVNFRLIEGDALRLDWQSLIPANEKIKVVGNIPYNITSPLLFKIITYSQFIQCAVLMVQKEIALRLCASQATREYGILTVLASFYGSVQIGFHIPPTVFRPRPKVWSTVIVFQPKARPYSPDFCTAFHTIVKKAFNQRRKTLKNALASLLPAAVEDCPLDLTQRAENLSCEDYIALTEFIRKVGRASEP